jgi:hypothetical protein
MTKSEIVSMAYEAGCPNIIVPAEWFRFAKLVAAAEREACAQIAHDTYEGFGPHAKGVDFVKQHIAIRIRERGAP